VADQRVQGGHEPVVQGQFQQQPRLAVAHPVHRAVQSGAAAGNDALGDDRRLRLAQVRVVEQRLPNGGQPQGRAQRQHPPEPRGPHLHILRGSLSQNAPQMQADTKLVQLRARAMKWVHTARTGASTNVRSIGPSLIWQKTHQRNACR
jgi:hypothetical protein